MQGGNARRVRAALAGIALLALTSCGAAAAKQATIEPVLAPTAREAWLMKFAERAEQPKTCTSGGRVLAPSPIVGSAAAAWGPAGSKPREPVRVSCAPYAAAGTALHRRFTDAR